VHAGDRNKNCIALLRDGNCKRSSSSPRESGNPFDGVNLLNSIASICLIAAVVRQ
jgi:hypothetical protein